MSKLIVLDAGHGGSDPGATYKGRRECDDTLKMVLRVKEHLESSGVTVKLTRSSDKSVSLTERSDFEKSMKTDFFISIHRNAFRPEQAKGVETFCYRKEGINLALATNIQNEIIVAGVNYNRGVKSDNFHVLRETKSPAALVEVGFIDNTEDNKLFDSKFEQYAVAIAKGILKTADVPYKAPGQPSSDVWYRVIIDNVQIEAHRALDTAKNKVKAEIDAGRGKVGKVQRNTDGAWLWEYKKEVTPPPVNKTPIMGAAKATAGQMKQFLIEKNSSPKINCSIDELVSLFISEGEIEGVRGDIALCQAIKESGWFRFGGDVVPEQNNYCGLGTTGGGVKGAYFDTPQMGIRAQIQHLQAYASKDTLKTEQIDPRYHLVTRGVAPNWEDLNGRWAVPGNGYGEEILKLYNELITKPEAPIVKPEPPVEEKPHECVCNHPSREDIINEIIDAINKLR